MPGLLTFGSDLWLIFLGGIVDAPGQAGGEKEERQGAVL